MGSLRNASGNLFAYYENKANYILVETEILLFLYNFFLKYQPVQK